MDKIQALSILQGDNTDVDVFHAMEVIPKLTQG